MGKLSDSNKRKKKKMFIDIGFFGPSKIKEKYKEYNSPYMLQQIYAAYLTALIACIFISWLFSFTLLNTLIVGVAFFLTTPVILISMQKYRYEAKKFMDINSYMQQFTQGMARNKKIYSTLEDTMIVFKDGEMKKTIQKAVEHLTVSWDAKISKVEALNYIEETYYNKMLIMIHDFCLRAEEHGGDFKRELAMLSQMREKWQKRMDMYQIKLKSRALGIIVSYIIFILLCGYIVRAVPQIMSIKHLPIIQAMEVLYIIGLCITTIVLQNKKCSSFFNDNMGMSMEEADEAMDYVENFDRKEQARKHRPSGIVCIVATSALAVTSKSWMIFVFGLVFGGLMLNLHNIAYIMTKKQIKDEMINEFPKWLFDISLLIQRNTIVNAISNSLFTAPPIMRRDIRRLEERLFNNPTDIYAFLDFLEEYEMNEVVNTMRSLISMKEGNVENNYDQMNELINYNLNLIDERENQQFEKAYSNVNLYSFLPFTFTSLLLCGYFIAISIVTFDYSLNII